MPAVLLGGIVSRYARAVDDNQGDIVVTLRRAGIRVFVTSALGKGFPDLFCYRPATGLIRVLEVKRGDLPPSAQKLTPAEEAFAKLFPVWVVRDGTEALNAMGIEVMA